MRNGIRRKSLAASACLVVAGLATAAPDRFAVTDQQLERLGVTLRVAEVVDTVEYAVAPAEIVVPPTRQALVNASHGGVIVRLLVAEGDTVSAGQIVAELDSLDYVEHQRDYLDALAASDLAAAQAARDRGLFEDGIIAERRVAESGAVANAARARVDHLRAELELAGLTGADLARLAERRELGKRIVLRAPFSGVVTAVHAQIGSRVDVLDPVAAIADLGELWLELNVPQERAARIVPGMLASVVAGGVAVNGTITTVGGVVDAVSQTVLVRAVVDNKGGMLRAGQFLEAHVLARSEGVVYAVPAAAVTRHEGQVLLFVRSGGDLVPQRIGVVSDGGERIYVGSGIVAGSLIAVDGISALKALWLAAEE